MPPPKSGHVVSAQEAELIRRWIAQGAPYADHWSFQLPKKAPLPAVRNAKWARGPLDRFVLARLEAAGLKPAPEADRYTLIRRLSLDLTGLPPSPSEVDEFAKDQRPDAYEKLVDRLLASPAYGERWAKMWLDLARYADSAGYGSDPLRMNIWPYRDWVIGAFNRNMPYDQFTIEQIAGDLLPNPTPEQMLATAFNRNTMTNTEGGTDDEEYRVAAVKDRIATTSQVWMGLTMGCAQCHSHKFDPITQREYYQFFAFFNQSEDADRGDEAPTMPIPTAAQEARAEEIKAEIAALHTRLAESSPAFLADLAGWEQAQSRPITWRDPEIVSAPGLQRLPDESLLATGRSAESYHLRLRVPVDATALRLEALPDESLPGKGPGRGASGAFALSDLRVSQSTEGKAPLARFVRIENPGAEKILSLAEVQVFSAGVNVAPRGKATQVSTDYGGEAQRAIDGNTNGDYYDGNSVTHTRQQNDPWWEVDLGSEVPLNEVVIWNRTDGNTGVRLANFRIVAYSADRKIAWETKVAKAPSPSVKLAAGGGVVLPLKMGSATAGNAGLAVDADGKSAWSVETSEGQSQIGLWRFAAPVKAGTVLEISLVQPSDRALGRFRFAFTADAEPPREVPHAIHTLLGIPADQRTPAQREELAAFYRPLAPSLQPVREALAKKETELAGIKPVAVPVMRELPDGKLRTTHLLIKGNFLNPGEEVKPILPAAFNKLPAGQPANRLGLAKWLVSRENPLTARVAVNRYWAQLFGIGIVETEEDFGTQGALPTDPALLDWLAVDFMDHGWDLKALLKTLVTSATYRQSAAVSPEAIARDPRNRLLSHFPRRRLDAEAVRDQALALSGMLSHKIGGPSVYPPQPDGLWRAAFNGERTWATSTGEDRYRRGLYTFWRRTVPYPSMATFDAPSREICTVRRIPTNTPLQALVTLNDPVYVELSQALGRRIVREGGATTADRARYGLRLALCRPPTEAQVQAVVGLFEKEQAHYRVDADAGKKLATDPLGPLPEGLDTADAAAWTVVGNVLLNLDGVLAKS
jgi:hypothetical protein